MRHSPGTGLFGSLKTQVNHDMRELVRGNQTLRRSRYSISRRLLRTLVVNRSIYQFLGLYFILVLLALVCEWAASRYSLRLLRGYYGATPRDFLKDVASYFIAAQIGVLAIVSVAVGVVTLLSQRDDGASINTDIRLYYVESYSYELAISGVALLIVLTLQLFWPLQHALHTFGLGGRDYLFKLALTALHALWLSFNLLLFLKFITTTLRFVEPSSREILRERYSATEVIPRDAKRRLLRTLYQNAPLQMFGEDALKDGPYISFGYDVGLDDDLTVEVSTVFSNPTRLMDVRLKPLQWVLERWRRRVQMQPPSKQRFGQPVWGGRLTILLNFDETLEDRHDWVLRQGGVPLTRFEKWIIRRSFRFRRAPRHEADLPTLADFLEQLIDKLVKQIEDSATTGSRAALADVIQYHRFILAAQNAKDEMGNTFNLAEVGGFFSRPDEEWVRQYRRAFVAACDKIGSDTYFIDLLSHVGARLIPDDALSFSERVLQTLLVLGVHEVVALEDWVTKRALVGSAGGEAGASAALTGSDKRAYENVLIGVVGAWENLQQKLISSFGVERRPSAGAANQQWTTFAKSFGTLQAHLHNAAFFLASAVWNDDALGADRFRDLLLRWLQPFYANLQATYRFSKTPLLTPDLVNQDWPSARTEIVRHMRFDHEITGPGAVSGILLWELHCDVVCITGLVALYWYVTGQQPSATAAHAAVLTLRREKRESDGSDLTATTPKTTFRLLFDFVIRHALEPRFGGIHYSTTIDELIRYLTNLASPRMVSGRVYGGWGIDGFDSLRSVLLAALAGNLPAQGDDGVAALIDDLKGHPVFQDDKQVRTLIWIIQEMIQTIATDKDDETFEKAARTFSPDLDLLVAAGQLKDILANVVGALEALRMERLRKASLDEDRMELVRQRITESVLASGPAISCFRGYSIRRDESGQIVVTPSEFGVIDKGAFVRPEMSSISFDDLPQLFVDFSREHLANLVWQDLYRQPKKRPTSIDVSAGTAPFWRRVIDEASNVGPEPMVLVPYDLFGEEIAKAAQLLLDPALPGFKVWYAADMPSGYGTGYVGTIEGIHVYSSQLMTKEALLCSRLHLRALEYGVVHGIRDIADLAFIESETPEKSRVRLSFAQKVEWADGVLVEFRITGRGLA